MSCRIFERMLTIAPLPQGARGWGEGAELPQAETPHPRPLSPEYRGEGSCATSSPRTGTRAMTPAQVTAVDLLRRLSDRLRAPAGPSPSDLELIAQLLDERA